MARGERVMWVKEVNCMVTNGKYIFGGGVTGEYAEVEI